MATEENDVSLRVALIGKTGCGKSALGNTLLGYKNFKSIPSGESVTTTCEVAEGILSTGQTIRVVDTPGLLDTKNVDVATEVTKSIGYLSPGPHAFIIVLQPNRATEEEKRVITDLKNLFGNERFLKHTLIVMVRKNEIRDEDGKEINIHTFIEHMAADDVKALYTRCDKRIVAVENMSSDCDKERYAQEVADKILKMDGYYLHDYFQLLRAQKIRDDEISRLKAALVKSADKNNATFCQIL